MNKELNQFIRESNLPENHQLTMRFLLDSIEKGKLGDFNDRIYLFGGDPGIGKTFFVENLLKRVNLPVLFLGPFKFEHSNVTQFNNMEELIKELNKREECIVFIDDLQNSFKMEADQFGEFHLSDDERKRFLYMLEHFKRSDKTKLLFITINDRDILEESWLDRIETIIDLEDPKEKSKRIFLESKYSKYIGKSLINEISEKSMGYSFRNLDDLIKIAHREGKGKITRKSIRKAMTNYNPTVFSHFKIIHKTNVNFKNIFGHEKIKKDISYLKNYIKHPRFFEKSGIERSNVLMFTGPPGTGKTFMAKALAGELNVPLINLEAKHILRDSGIGGIGMFSNIARKFRNCVIFIDELDKLIGHDIMAEDGGVIGNLEAELDGMKEKAKAIVIFTMNNEARFGRAFHDRIPCFKFEYPSIEERRTYFENKIKKTSLPFSQDHINTLVNETENRSFRQMEKILNNIIFNIMEKPETSIKNNKLNIKEEYIDESIKEILSYVNTTKQSSMIG